MATYNFTTSGSNWSLIVDGSTKGPWPRHSSGISSPLYKVDTTGTAVVLSVNAEPYYSAKIRSTDTVQINGVEKTGTLTEKEMAIESEAIAAASTGGGGASTLQDVLQTGNVLTGPSEIQVPSGGINIIAGDNTFTESVATLALLNAEYSLYVQGTGGVNFTTLYALPTAIYLEVENNSAAVAKGIEITENSVQIKTESEGGIVHRSVVAVRAADDFADDAAAATGGIPVGQFYHTAGTVKIRLV